jgi:hypothetical protein
MLDVGSARTGAFEMEREQAMPDSATWDPSEDSEIELLGNHEAEDIVDVVDEGWAPGEPPPGVPGEEVLHVHRLTEREPPPEELEISAAERDELGLESGALSETEPGR